MYQLNTLVRYNRIVHRPHVPPAVAYGRVVAIKHVGSLVLYKVTGSDERFLFQSQLLYAYPSEEAFIQDVGVVPLPPVVYTTEEEAPGPEEEVLN